MYLTNVSILCATHNRQHMLPLLLHQFIRQTYPKHLIELIILDDSTTPLSEELNDIINTDSRVKYHYSVNKDPLWIKRNKLNELSTGDIIVWMDDDDIYFNTYIEHVVILLNKQLSKQVACCRKTLLYYPNDNNNNLYVINNKISNHSLAYKRSFLKNHSYKETKHNFNEEFLFLDHYNVPVVHLNPWYSCIHVCHGTNTVSKESFKYKARKFNKSIIDVCNDNYVIDFIKHHLKKH